MFSLPLLVALTAAQAPSADTVPLPPLDTAWTRLPTVAIRGVDLPDEVSVWIVVDQWGRVEEAQADTSLGLDEDARSEVERKAAGLRFVPAEPQSGWSRLMLPIRAERPRPEPTAPTFTPFTRRPGYADPQGALRIVERYYPPHLRQAGIGGTVMVWVFIDELGVVGNAQVKESSGRRELDEAAERAAWAFNFTPAYSRGEPCPAWVAVPITFSAKHGARYQPTPIREFTLGPRRYPVADAVLKSSKDRFPELIRPEFAEQQLTRLFLDSDASEPLGLLAEITIEDDGRVRSVEIRERRPEGQQDSQLERTIVEAIEEFQFRPAIRRRRPDSATMSAWFVFDQQLGLIPSVSPDSCVGGRSLKGQPQFTGVDEPAELATPTWERARIISETWPIAFQQEGRRYEHRLWYLIDEQGRVCETKVLLAPDRFTTNRIQKIAERLRFRPAVRDGVPVASWRQEILAFSF
ncbi:MAG: energy transducer TonB [Gemmatimonadota bacterium]|nr:MAG: energy transducer TonB [Gemmatimonadota bacterium]